MTNRRPIRPGQPARQVLDKAMTETELGNVIIDYAQMSGWLIIHHRPARTKQGWRTAMQGNAGFPDLVLARRQRVIFAELKTMGKDPDANQTVWLRAIGAPQQSENGESMVDVEVSGLNLGHLEHIGLVWRPSDWSSGLIRRILE